MTTEYDDIQLRAEFSAVNELPWEQAINHPTYIYVWECSLKHRWERSLKEQNRFKTCPYCSGKRILQGFNDILTLYPNIDPSSWDNNKNKQPITNISPNSNIKYFWVCDKGHSFYMSPYKRVILNQNCPYCSNRKVLQGFNDIPTLYPKLVKEWSKNNSAPITKYTYASHHIASWICDKGHEWETEIRKRTIRNQNCPTCSNNRVLKGFNDAATFAPHLLPEWSNNNKDSLQDYTYGSEHSAYWTCSKGHKWKSNINNRTLKNSQCPTCQSGKSSSAAEKELGDYLKSFFPNLQTNDRTILNGRELDLYVPEKHIAIEYNGLYWHSEAAGKEKEYHYQKWVECRNKGIQLITVWEDDYTRNPELVKTMLAYKLGLQQGNRVYGRNTRVRSISPLEALLFLDQNHIQGSIAGSIRVGLEDKTTGKLVAVMVLKKEYEGVLNLLRYSTSGSVIGGFSKLLKHVVKEYTPTSIITFSDHMVSDGGLYEKNGFVAVKELPPDYMYIVNNERKHKFGYRLTRFRNDPTLQYKEELTEHKLALLNGLYRVYDAGKTKWEKLCFSVS